MMNRLRTSLIFIFTGLVCTTSALSQSQTGIAADVYTWAFPILQNYRLMYQEAINVGGLDYEGPFNTMHHRMFNAESYHSSAWLDLRTEPMVLTIPAMPPSIYSVVRITDMQTYVAAEFVLRPGRYLITGKTQHTTSGSVDSVVHCESDFVAVKAWTQVVGRDTATTLAALQGLTVQPAHVALGGDGPMTFAPSINFPPYTPRVFTSAEVLPTLAMLLNFMEIHPSDRGIAMQLMKLSRMPQDTINIGIAGAMTRIAGRVKVMGRQGNGWTLTEGLYGPRSTFNGDHLRRAAACMDAVHGPTDHETLVAFVFFPSMTATLSFTASNLPPVNRSWAICIDGMPNSVLTSSTVKRTKKGGVDIVLSATEPPASPTVNWLQIKPGGTVSCSIYMYAPKEELFQKKWLPPTLKFPKKR